MHVASSITPPRMSGVIAHCSVRSRTTDECDHRRFIPVPCRMVAAAGVILMSPLRSAMRVVGLGMGFLDTYIGDIFVNQAKIDRIACPVFIVHGLYDDIVPVEHGKVSYAPS